MDEKKYDDLINRQDAIDEFDGVKFCEVNFGYEDGYNDGIDFAVSRLSDLPSVQPEISRIEQELHGKTPEEQYEFLYWLLLKFGLAYTDSRLAVIEWLRGEK